MWCREGVWGEVRNVPPACGDGVGPVFMEPLDVLRAFRRVCEADELETGG